MPNENRILAVRDLQQDCQAAQLRGSANKRGGGRIEHVNIEFGSNVAQVPPSSPSAPLPLMTLQTQRRTPKKGTQAHRHARNMHALENGRTLKHTYISYPRPPTHTYTHLHTLTHTFKVVPSDVGRVKGAIPHL